MGKSRSPNRDKAFEIYREHGGRISSKEISIILNEKVTNIYAWKNSDKWDKRLERGAPLGNKNSVGNKGGGAPLGNLNNLKHGDYCSAEKFLDKGFLKKYIPAATRNIIKGLVEEGVSPLDMLWDNIVLCYTGIIRSQKIMNVKSNSDITKELKKQSWGKNESEEYEIQFAWDKQERFIKAQALAMQTLNTLIKDYEDMLHKNRDLATEEQKLRIEVLKSKINNHDEDKEDKIDKYFSALEGALKND